MSPPGPAEPGIAVEARQLVRYARPRRPALQLRGQGQGRLAERHAVKRGRRAVGTGRHPGPFGPFLLLFPL